MATVIVGETDAQAWESTPNTRATPIPWRRWRITAARSTSISRYGLDEPIQAQATQGIQTLLDSITTRSAQTWTVRCWRRCRTATGCRPS